MAWHDERGVDRDIYAQHVLGTGVVDLGWTANGTLLCNAPGPQFVPTIASDDSGGAIVTWQDPRGANFDIYAQRVLATGVVHPVWVVNGNPLCTAANTQYGPTIAPDGVRGALITWQDFRAGNLDIYATRVYFDGTPALASLVSAQANSTACGSPGSRPMAPASSPRSIGAPTTPIGRSSLRSRPTAAAG